MQKLKKKNDKKKIHLSFLYCIVGYRLNNFVTLRSIQHASGNGSLKGPTLGSADKYTTLLPLAWPIKPAFHLRVFSYKATFY